MTRGKTVSVQMDQWINLKFLVKCLGKTATEGHAIFKEVYGHEWLSRTHAFKWFKMFRELREMTENDARRG